MKKIVLGLILLLVLAMTAGCGQSWERTVKDWNSEYGGGLDREINVYSYDNQLMRSYEGKVDIDPDSTAGKVKFDLNGKRAIIYGAVVIIEEKGIEVQRFDLRKAVKS